VRLKDAGVSVHHLAPGVEIRCHQETEVFETMSPTKKPDPSWRYIDRNQHAHVWDGDKLPTLGVHVTGKTWVGDEYDGCEVEVTEHRCLVCGAVVTPGYVHSYDPIYVPGPATHTLVLHAGLWGQEYPIPPEDVEALVEILGRIFR